ncbi:4452_t:CDS:1, partial [Cetraspora pellucida]
NDNNSIYNSKLISYINQQLHECVISDNNIDIDKIKMDTENIKMDIDSKKRKMNIALPKR